VPQIVVTAATENEPSLLAVKHAWDREYKLEHKSLIVSKWDCKDLKEKLEAESERCKDLERICGSLNQDRQSVWGKHKRLEQELESTTGRCKSLEQKLESARTCYTDLQRNYDTAIEKCKSLKQELESASGKCSSLERELESMLGSPEYPEDSVAVFQSHIRDLEAEIVTQGQELNHMASRERFVDNELLDLRRENLRLHAQIA
jgi:chromosome segregation ATPase